jgi:hypothetical protein
MQPGYPGMPATMPTWDADSLIVETVAGIGFGLAVGIGAKDNTCVLGGAANFVGVTYRDITLMPSALPGAPAVDTYPQGATAGVMVRGDIWVSPSEIVAAKDPVVYDNTTGRFHKTAAAGSTAVTNARWMRGGAANGLALLRIGMKQPQ